MPSPARLLTLVEAVVAEIDGWDDDLRVILPTAQHFRYRVLATNQALAIFCALGDRWGQGLALNTSARANIDLRRFEEATATCRQALSVHREIGDRTAEVDALNTLSAACRGMGRSGEAVGYSRQALSIVQETGDRHGEGITLSKLGAALCADGRPTPHAAAGTILSPSSMGSTAQRQPRPACSSKNSMHAKPASMMPNSRRSHAERH
jgi:tetratricopeptide (TPR) repeat protein